MSVLFNLQTLGQQKNKIIDCTTLSKVFVHFSIIQDEFTSGKSISVRKNFGLISVTVVVNSTVSWTVVTSPVSWTLELPNSPSYGAK